MSTTSTFSYTNLDTYLYDISIPAINSLQSRLAGSADLMGFVSTVFDPKYAFLIYSPMIYLLSPRVGRRLIMTVVLAEWLNMILKWILHGERPYWYVHSSGHFDQQVSIKQFPITCELGPGHPSGHAMLTAAVWYIIIDSMLAPHRRHAASARIQATLSRSQPTSETDHNSLNKGQLEDDTTTTTNNNNNNNNIIQGCESTNNMLMKLPKAHQSNRRAQLLSWSLYCTLIAFVSVSRVFLGCHFPHQCLAGAALGYLLARWVSRQQSRAAHFVAASGFLLATAFATFAILQALGFDPSWTIRLATKHCEKHEYIHMDTAPFFSIMRYCGFALGTGLGLMFPLNKPDALQRQHQVGSLMEGRSNGKLSSRSLSWLAPKIAMALIMARLVDNLGLFVSHSNLPVFYSSAFAAYTAFSYAFINLA